MIFFNAFELILFRKYLKSICNLFQSDYNIECFGKDSNHEKSNNCNAIIETSTNTLIAGCQNTVIPNSVTSIGECAFYNCDSLVSVVIPNSVTSIGNEAFYSCDSLVSIVIPNSVTSIGDNAFGGCRSLTSITIPESVTSIGGYAFDGCPIVKSRFTNNSSLDEEENNYLKLNI